VFWSISASVSSENALGTMLPGKSPIKYSSSSPQGASRNPLA
jgi:hypothetical protein